jgi:hypothetical protein
MHSHRKLAVLTAVLIAGALACATVEYPSGANVDTEYDFSKVKTFAFALVPEKPLNSEHGKMLRQAIEQSMIARGFEMTSEGVADLWIAYDIGLISASSVNWGDQSTLGEGRIIVRANDPATRHEVWYGWAEAHIRRDGNPSARIPAAVEALFEGRVRNR